MSLMYLVFSLRQMGLVNMVSASLIHAPDYKETFNAARLELIQVASRVAGYDAEFILKVIQPRN